METSANNSSVESEAEASDRTDSTSTIFAWFPIHFVAVPAIFLNFFVLLVGGKQSIIKAEYKYFLTNQAVADLVFALCALYAG